MFFGSLAYGFFLIKLVSSNILSQNNVVNLSEGKSKFCICNVGNTTVTQKKQINFTNKDVSVIIGVILSIYLVGFVFIISMNSDDVTTVCEERKMKKNSFISSSKNILFVETLETKKEKK
ncbi:uncharacterized protein LOC105846504 isoform X1 [Hydra vulgaris]|uniref:uncharacterized protein LOC105846504 isoform X1 n=1 Tax=Hydra vulgaris TaxID=6087 RepID=UPI000640E784|nr:uncharacterized protein LOC105846504 isoform X1 [Hydra vulgaris]